MTKKQRNKVYTKTLEELKKRKKYYDKKSSFPCKPQYGMCIHLITVSKIHSFIDIYEKFPEFASFKPKNKGLSEYWVDERQYNIRETVLLFCIEMTK